MQNDPGTIQALFSKEAVESKASALTQEPFLGQRFIQKIQLSTFVGCFSDSEWGRRDSKVQLLSFPLNVVRSVLWPGPVWG